LPRAPALVNTPGVHGALRRLVVVACAVGGLEGTARPDGPQGTSAATGLAEGDAHYERRAEGARGLQADPVRIDAALAAYRRALAAAPESLEAVYKLQRALFFRASFCGAPDAEGKRLFDEGRKLGQRAVDRLERQAAGKRGSERIAALRAVPDAPPLYFWTAVCWGQWAVLHGKLAAARTGAAGRVRDLAQTLLELDAALEQGGADRLLGRLHHQAPRIPLLTGWVSRPKALAHLRRALELGALNTVNQVFLAEGLLDLEPARKQEARELLTRCAEAVPRPEYQVEDAFYAAEARRLLAGLR
jgi:hypothetical protein